MTENRLSRSLGNVLILFSLSAARSQSTYSPSVGPNVIVNSGVWQLYVYYAQWSGVFSNTLAFPTDSLFLDGAGSNIWVATSPFAVTIAPTSAADQDRLGYAAHSSGLISTRAGILPYDLQAANGYEQRSPCSGGSCSCSYTASLAKNATTYSCFLLQPAGHQFSVQAVVSVGTSTLGRVVLQPWSTSSSFVSSSSLALTGSANIMGVSLTRTATYDFNSGELRWCLANQASNGSDPGFLVNTTFFGAAQNQIGISEGNFSTCVGSYPTGGDGCSSAPYGACTAVNSGSPYDQFSSFRSQLWGSYIPLDNTWSCSFFGNGPLQPGSSAFGTQYKCNYTGANVYLAVELGANANSLPLVYGFSRISVVGYGMAAWAAGSLSGSLETRLQNTGNVTGQFTLTRSSCTAGSAAAPSSITLTAGVGQTVRFSFAVTVNQTGASGQCDFAVTGFGLNPQPGISISFVATPPLPPPQPPVSPPPAAPPPPPATIYPYLNASINFNGAGVYNDTFISRYRAAVAASAGVTMSNVLIISTVYSGRRLLQATLYVINMQIRFSPGYYSTSADNYKTLLTNSISSAFASDSSFYSSYGPANAITGNFAQGFYFVSPPPSPPRITPPPPPYTVPPPGTISPPQPASSPPLPPGVSCAFGVPDCGQHGSLAAPCSCVCDFGWTTNTNQDFSNYTYCSIAVLSEEGYAPPPPPGGPSPEASSSSSGGLAWYEWVAIVMGLLALAFVSLQAVRCCQDRAAAGERGGSLLTTTSRTATELLLGLSGKGHSSGAEGKKRSFKNVLFEEEDAPSGPSMSASSSAENRPVLQKESPQQAAKPVSRRSAAGAFLSAASNLMAHLVQGRSAPRKAETEASRGGSGQPNEVALVPLKTSLEAWLQKGAPPKPEAAAGRMVESIGAVRGPTGAGAEGTENLTAQAGTTPSQGPDTNFYSPLAMGATSVLKEIRATRAPAPQSGSGKPDAAQWFSGSPFDPGLRPELEASRPTSSAPFSNNRGPPRSGNSYPQSGGAVVQHATNGFPSSGQQTIQQRPMGTSQEAMTETTRPRLDGLSFSELSGPSHSAPTLQRAELYGNTVVDPYRINNVGGVSQARSAGGQSQIPGGAVEHQQGFTVSTPQVGPTAPPECRPWQRPLQLRPEYQSYSSGHGEIRPESPERAWASAPGLHPFEYRPQMQMRPGLPQGRIVGGPPSDSNLARQPTSPLQGGEGLAERGQQSLMGGVSGGTKEAGRAEGPLSVAAMASQQAQRALQSKQRQGAAKWN